jgi:ABC-type multidrug transport system fused ATPase/permease subunit
MDHDNMIVLVNRCIMESGTPAELLRKGPQGLFYKMVHSSGVKNAALMSEAAYNTKKSRIH